MQIKLLNWKVHITWKINYTSIYKFMTCNNEKFSKDLRKLQKELKNLYLK